MEIKEFIMQIIVKLAVILIVILILPLYIFFFLTYFLIKYLILPFIKLLWKIIVKLSTAVLEGLKIQNKILKILWYAILFWTSIFFCRAIVFGIPTGISFIIDPPSIPFVSAYQNISILIAYIILIFFFTKIYSKESENWTSERLKFSVTLFLVNIVLDTFVYIILFEEVDFFNFQSIWLTYAMFLIIPRFAERLLLNDIHNKKSWHWGDLIRLINHSDFYVRRIAGQLIVSFVQYIPNKEEAWTDIHRLTKNWKWDVREFAASSIGNIFPYVSDKEKAWKDLHQLTMFLHWDVKSAAVDSLGSVFPHVPDKEEAWTDIHRLIREEYNRDVRAKNVREHATDSLGLAFPYIPDKEEAWKDLHWLTKDNSVNVRIAAAFSIGLAFPYIPDKEEAWKDLHRLTKDKHVSVRGQAAEAIGNSFFFIPDKKKACKDLHRLTQDEYNYSGKIAAHVLGYIISLQKYQSQECEIIHELVEEKSVGVREGIAISLGHYFENFSDEKQVIDYLHQLSIDSNNLVRAAANYSLGKIYVLKANEAENIDNLKNELKIAMEFFKKSSNDTFISEHPAKFCFSFYRLISLIFNEKVTKVEIEKYINEVKNAKGGSKIKKVFLKKFENLFNARCEYNVAEKMDLDEIKHILYREVIISESNLWDKAKFFETDEELAPNTVKLIKKGIGMYRENIKRPYEYANIPILPSKNVKNPLIWRILNSGSFSASIAALVGFITLEVLVIYPTDYNRHVVSVIITVLIFVFTFLFMKKKMK